MSKIDLVSILVRQLCEVDDHESDLAEDALYDFASNPNTSLSEKQDALALMERKIKHIAEDIGFFLTSSLRTPKFFIKEFSDFLMPCHQHGLRINLLVQR